MWTIERGKMSFVLEILVSPWMGFFFNVATLLNLLLAVNTFRRSESVAEEVERLRRKALLRTRGPVLLDKLGEAQGSIISELSAPPIKFNKIDQYIATACQHVSSFESKIPKVDPEENSEEASRLLAVREAMPGSSHRERDIRRFYNRLSAYIVFADNLLQDEIESIR
jgi:hypothetical protein